MEITLAVNGEDHRLDVEPRMLLVHVLREVLELTGTHLGCDTTSCGACTVLLDGEPVKSCTVFGVQADGRAITTVEGLARDGQLDPIQEGFSREHGLQCGFCTPGMMLVGRALLDEEPDPSEEEIRWAISGNICRCTGYQNIVKAVRYAAEAGQADGGRAADGSAAEAADGSAAEAAEGSAAEAAEGSAAEAATSSAGAGSAG